MLGAGVSNYCAYDGARLVHPLDDQPPSPLTEFVHDSVRALVLNEHFTCVGAKSALRHRAYRFGFYPPLGSPDAAAGVADDLATFVREAAALDGEFSTFIASFDGPAIADEPSFERLLWTTLQQVHDLDAARHAWDPAVSADPEDPAFSFSLAGTAFFVVGLHAAASRATRRFAWPTLVFNPHRQFEQLKAHGRYTRFQQVIRTAERTLQGDVNPMLADFGSRSEAAQYSGRRVGADWKCPFHAHPAPARSEKP
jgi:FPC/CPF motif-containing protein YcgG